MSRFTALFLPLVLMAHLCLAEPQQPRSHASREAAIQLLRSEGILHGKTSVAGATWSGTFWFISLRHPDGKTTNWTVDAAAKDYSYICRH